MKARILQVLSDVTGLAPSELGDNPSMDLVQAWDSVAQLNIIMSLEQEFGVQFSADEVVQLSSLAAIETALQLRGAA